MIELNHVTFRYKGISEGGVYDLSLKIREGEVVLLCGASGCGKTTAARLINGLIPHYYKGELTSGLDLAHMNQVAEQLKRLRDMGKTILVVTHDTELILACCDDMVRLENGHVAEICSLAHDEA